MTGAPPRFIVIDTAAHGYDGHSYAYAAEVLEAASEEGLATVLAGSTALQGEVSPAAHEVVPCFSRDCYGRFAAPQPWSNRVLLGLIGRLEGWAQHLWPVGLRWRASQAARGLEGWYLRVRFAIELRRALCRIDARPEDTLLMPTLDDIQVGGWSVALRFMPARRVPTTALLFRHNLGPGGPVEAMSPPREAAGLARDLAGIRRTPVGGRVHFVSDSRRLAEQHEAFTGLPYRPVPNVVPRFRSGRSVPREDGVFHFGYLGNVRPEKGFSLLLQAVQELPPVPNPRLDFTLQVTPNLGRDDPYYDASLETARGLAARGVRLVTRILPPEAYDELLRSVDAVLVPYDPRTYYARTSAIFSEAVAAGRLVVVPADTWMEEELDHMRGGGIAFSPYEPAALAQAIADLAGDPAHYAADPGAVARWCADNSAGALVRFLRALDGREAARGTAA